MKIQHYLGNPNLKRAGQKIGFTKEQVEEYIRCRDDKIYFAEKYMKIVHIDKGLINIPLYEYQKKLLKVLDENRFVICLQSRQSGKTTTITVDILHYILFNSHKTVAILANKGATAREILSRIQLAYENLPLWLQQGVLEWNKGSFELENGTRIITAGTSGDSIRGQSISYLLVDEAAFLDIWDEFYASTYPTISSGQSSRIVLVSTANGTNHYWKMFTEAQSGKNNYYPVEVSWRDVPGRDEKWRKETISNTSYEAFLQEHENQFLGSSNTLVPTGALKSMQALDPIYTTGTFRAYENPKEDHQYVITVDTARGKGLDYSAFSVIDVTDYPFRQVATYYDNKISPLMYPAVVAAIGTKYNDAYLLVETNDIGDQIVNMLNYEIEYENVISIAEDGGRHSSLGVRTTKKVKSIGCSVLRDLIESGKLIIPDKDTIFELSGFVQKGKSYEADTGYHDDLVMTLVLFSWLTTQVYFDNIREGFTITKDLFGKDIRDLEDELAPFGFIMDGTEDEFTVEQIGGETTVWTHV